MRIAILPALLPAVLFPAFAQVAKPAPAPDPQVRQLLDELEYEYEVDEDGDYRLVFEVANSTEKRSQLVYVRSPVETYGALRLREVWAPGYKAAGTDFPAAVAFVNRLVPEAEAADHHPDIVINYRRVTLLFSTHSEGGLTQKDFDGASMAERQAVR